MKRKVWGWVLWLIIQIGIIWVTISTIASLSAAYPNEGFSWGIFGRALLILIPLFIASWFSWKLAHPNDKKMVDKKGEEI